MSGLRFSWSRKGIVALLLPRIRSEELYLDTALCPKRATLAIGWKGKAWTIWQLAGIVNSSVAPAVYSAVYRWIADNLYRSSKVSDAPDAKIEGSKKVKAA